MEQKTPRLPQIMEDFHVNRHIALFEIFKNGILS
jgi:hypothetical protein